MLERPPRVPADVFHRDHLERGPRLKRDPEPAQVEAYHAVVGASKTTQGTYVSPWTSSSAMACSDCHTTNVKAEPQGAHGSGINHILAGAYDATTGSGTSGGHLCFKCHSFSPYVSGSGSGSGFRKDTDNLHGKHMTGEGRRCVNCHAAVPHGLNRRALVVFTGDASPYNRGDARITGMPGGWQTPGNWQQSSCSTGAGCH